MAEAAAAACAAGRKAYARRASATASSAAADGRAAPSGWPMGPSAGLALQAPSTRCSSSLAAHSTGGTSPPSPAASRPRLASRCAAPSFSARVCQRCTPQ
jgi:hypothetical protein